MLQFCVVLGLLLLLAWVARSLSVAAISASPLKVVLMLSAPAVLAAIVLAASVESATSLRFRLSGVRFAAAAQPQQPTAADSLSVLVGSDVERADFLVRRLPPSFATLTATVPIASSAPSVAAPRAQVALEYLPPATVMSVTGGQNSGVRGVVALGTAPNFRLLGEVALVSGDQVHVALASGQIDLTVVDERRLRAADGRIVALPRLTTRLPLLDWPIKTARYPDVRTRTYALDDLIQELAPQPRPQGDDAAQSELASFLFYKTRLGGFQADLYLALLDTSVSVDGPNGRHEYRQLHQLFSGVVPSDMKVASPELDRGVLLRFCGLGQRAVGLSSLERLGIRDFRSGRLWLQRGESTFLTYDLDTPDLLNFTPAQARQLALSDAAEDNDPNVRRRLYLSLVSDVLPEKAIAFSSLPRVFSAGGQAILEETTAGDIVWRTPGGELPARYGEGTWLGDRFQGLVQVDQMGPTLTLLTAIVGLTVPAVALLVLIGPTDRRLLVLFGSLQILLSVRLLISFKAYNSGPSSHESYALGFLTLVLVPWVLAILAHLVKRNAALAGWTRVLHAVLFVATTVISLALMGGGNGVAAAALAALVWMSSDPTARGAIGVVSSALQRVATRWPAWIRTASLSRTMLRARGVPRSTLHWAVNSPSGWAAFALIVAIGAVLVALRGVGVLIGFRERIPIGIPIAISIVYTPLLLASYCVGAAVWHRRGYPGRDALPYFASWVAFVLLGCLVAGGLASDLGIPLILSWPLFVECVRSSWTRGPRFRVGAVVMVGLASLLLMGWRVTPEPVLERLFAHQDTARWDRNKLRLLHYTYPTALPSIGRRDSDNLAIMSQVLGNYTRSGWNGRGYMEAEVTSLLGPTILREHVPAVFIAADFGHFGTLLLVFAYLVPLGFYLRPPPVVGSTIGLRHHWRKTLSELSIATFAISSVYMVLANYDLVPFTGKNVYFLGLDSFGDVIEALALLIIAVIA